MERERSFGLVENIFEDDASRVVFFKELLKMGEALDDAFELLSCSAFSKDPKGDACSLASDGKAGTAGNGEDCAFGEYTTGFAPIRSHETPAVRLLDFRGSGESQSLPLSSRGMGGVSSKEGIVLDVQGEDWLSKGSFSFLLSGVSYRSC